MGLVRGAGRSGAGRGGGEGGGRNIKSQRSRDVPHCVGGLQGNKPVGRGVARLDGCSPLSLPPTFGRGWRL